MKINSKEFLTYIKQHDRSNTFNFVSSIRVNKKSISVKIDDKHLLFNSMFNEKNLYNLILKHLINFTSKDKDFLEYKYPFKSFKVN